MAPVVCRGEGRLGAGVRSRFCLRLRKHFWRFVATSRLGSVSFISRYFLASIWDFGGKWNFGSCGCIGCGILELKSLCRQLRLLGATGGIRFSVSIPRSYLEAESPCSKLVSWFCIHCGRNLVEARVFAGEHSGQVSGSLGYAGLSI